MLYVTTRNSSDMFTAFRALSESRGPDGGFYIPYKLTPFSREEVVSLAQFSSNQRIARILERFLGIRLSETFLDLHIGRYPVQLSTMGYRIGVGEIWHNCDSHFSRLVEDIGSMLQLKEKRHTPLLELVVRVATLFALYGEILHGGHLDTEDPFDVSVVSGNFFGPLSAWYARELGLPVENIICCCNENNGLWNLIYHGELRTDTVCVNTIVPEADVTVPDGLECLIRTCCGSQEVQHYLESIRAGRMYCPDNYFESLRKGFHVSVISDAAILRAIPNVFSTSGTVLAPSGALAYSGLLDYRSRTGESRFGLVITERGPQTDIDNLARSFCVSPSEVREWLKKM